MSTAWFVLLGLTWIVIATGLWLGWQLLSQNGRLLLRLDELEGRFDSLEIEEQTADQRLVASTEGNNGDNPATRFGNRSLARSKIKREGLKAGTVAPEFCLPLLNGDQLALADLRGRRVLLVFSDPHCGPCNALAPRLQAFHSDNPVISLVMISRGDPKENRSKAKEHGLTFPIVLQRQWEISRLYAIFATPVAYLIDNTGIIVHDVMVGIDAIENLLLTASNSVHRSS